MIKLLNSLDREVESQYKIVVRITDMDNDAIPDPLRQRSSTAHVTVNVLVRINHCLQYCYSEEKISMGNKNKKYGK